MPFAALKHVFKNANGYKHGAFGVYVYGADYVGVGLFGEHLVVGDDAGAVYEYVDSGADGLGLGVGDVNRFGRGNVGLESVYFAEGGEL